MYPGSFLNDELAKYYLLNEIQNSLTEISPAFTLESLNLPKPPEHFYHIQLEDANQLKTRKLLKTLS